MQDPLADMIALLQPGAPFSKLVNASGPWRVRRTEVGRVYYCAILTGRCKLAIDGDAPIQLSEGDFVLVPAAFNFTMSSIDPEPADDMDSLPITQADGTIRLGSIEGSVEVQQLVGYCTFGSKDAALLVSCLPKVFVVRSEQRPAILAKLVRDEIQSDRPAREVVLDHLLQLLLIEALRSSTETTASPGLLRGLADARIGAALRFMHEEPGRGWSISELAARAGMSRSAFFTRFSDLVGVAPMSYLLNWRMILAKHLLRTGESSIAEIAQRVGYGSTSAFSTAFTREVGKSPARYAHRDLNTLH